MKRVSRMTSVVWCVKTKGEKYIKKIDEKEKNPVIRLFRKKIQRNFDITKGKFALKFQQTGTSLQEM